MAWSDAHSGGVSNEQLTTMGIETESIEYCKLLFLLVTYASHYCAFRSSLGYCSYFRRNSMVLFDIPRSHQRNTDRELFLLPADTGQTLQALQALLYSKK